MHIRFEDRFKIMEWRNDQIYHLRQAEKLTATKQTNYFKNVINIQKEEDKPDQVLFSLLKNKDVKAYGGFVHINWLEKTAELSFVMDTIEEKNNFNIYWDIFLKLIDKVIIDIKYIDTLNTYAFDLRPSLYKTLEKNNFTFLKNDIYYKNGNRLNVKIHQKNFK